MRRVEGRQVGIDHRLRRHRHRLQRVRNVERVQVDHHRQQHLLGHAVSLQHRVQRLLRTLDVELDPAGVALGQAVGLIGPEGPGRGHRAVDIGHHDRCPRAGGVVQQLVHQQQALRGGGGEDAHAGQRGRDAGRHHGMLGLDGDDLGIELTAGLELGQQLEHRRLRRDRIDGGHLGPRQARGPGHGVVAGQQHGSLVVHRRSSTIFIEPVGHSRTHRPQPLQYSPSTS